MVKLPNMAGEMLLKLTKNPNMYYDKATKQSSGFFRKNVIKISVSFEIA